LIAPEVGVGIHYISRREATANLEAYCPESRFEQPQDLLRPPFADFLRARLDFFREGTLPPFRLASLKPIAIACFRLFTLLPELLFRVPFLRRCIADFTRF
jgi:hypothetical protein